MIIVQLLGGLGNQLFQYSLGRSLSLKHGVPLSVDTRLLEDKSPGRHLVNRRFALDIFSANIQRTPLHRAIRYSADGLPAPVRRLLRLSRVSDLSRRTTERQFGFDPTILDIRPPSYFSGLWQSELYFTKNADAIRQDLQFRHELIPQSHSIADSIRATNSVCLHVRRTDYVSNTSNNSSLQFVGIDYYKNAIERVLEELPNPRFFIFSDDLDWCRSELSFLPNAEFVGNEHAGYKDGGHLQLMSMCRSFIIPNSTFSWWAAWLCEHSDKRVFLPSRWFGDANLDSSGLYPNGWSRVEVSSTRRRSA